MKAAQRKRFIFFTVIICSLLLLVPLLFSSRYAARTPSERRALQEKQVRIYGEDKITITATDSFHPKQYYKVVDEQYQPVQLHYNDITTTKPGRYALILTAKNKKDYDKRTVSVIVEKARPAPDSSSKNKESSNQSAKTPAAEKTTDDTTTHSTQQPAAETAPPTEVPQTPTESQSTQEIPEETYQAAPPPEQPAANPATQQAIPPAEPNPPAPEPTQPIIQANQISFHGQSIPYQNAGQGSGQGIINGGATAATWGGNPTQSGTDGQNTHSIGHNPGIFSPVVSLGVGETITVTDSAGNSTAYVVTGLVQVDGSGRDPVSGQDYWDQITSAGGGERITLQTCLADSINLIVFAQA